MNKHATKQVLGKDYVLCCAHGLIEWKCMKYFYKTKYKSSSVMFGRCNIRVVGSKNVMT